MTITRVPGPGHKVLAALAMLNESQVRVGWLDKKSYENGVNIAYVASIQEYGYTPHNLPPRLGLRQVIAEKKNEWHEISEQSAKAVIAGKEPMIFLEVIGGKVEGDVREHIRKVVSPPLKESTLRNRAHNLGISIDQLSETGKKPLVEPARPNGGSGGILLAHLTHLIYGKGSSE